MTVSFGFQDISPNAFNNSGIHFFLSSALKTLREFFHIKYIGNIAIGIITHIGIVYMNKKSKKLWISFSGGTLNTIIKNIYKITIVPIVNPIVVHRFFLRSVSNSFSFGTTYFA